MESVDATARAGRPGELPIYKHTILPPREGTSADADSECLLAISPGAMLRPEAFEALALAVQAAVPHLRLWVGILNVDFADITRFFCGPPTGPPTAETFAAVSNGMRDADGYNQLLQQLLDQAAARGFVARGQGPDGQLANLALLCQSAGAVGFAPVGARRASACVLLASVLNPLEHARRRPLSVETWPTPLLVLAGELDGQMRWHGFTSYVSELAAMAAKFGPGYAAATKPVIILPGINHGNTSNGEARLARGDVGAGQALELSACMQVLGGRIASFLTVHFASEEEARAKARLALLGAVRQSMRSTAPYGIALGLGDWSALFGSSTEWEDATEAALAGVAAAGPCLPGGLVAGACRVPGSAELSALHPGLVAAAEAHAAELQRLLLGSLPETERGRLLVAATAHHEADSFARSEATLVPLPGLGGRWLLHVHVLLHFRSLESDRPYICPNAPEYWIKLKSAELVAAVLSLPDPNRYPSPPPSALNRLAMERALAAVPAEVAERYRARGRKLIFEDDGDVAPVGPDAGAGSPAPRELFSAGAPGALFRYPPAAAAPVGSSSGPPPASTPPPPTVPPAPAPEVDPASLAPVRVVSPCVLVPMPAKAKSLEAPGRQARLAGSYYSKVMSVAQAMEWVWVDCLRTIDTPW